MRIEKLAEALKDALESKLVDYNDSIYDPLMSYLTFQKGNYTYTIEGYTKKKGNKITFTSILNMIEYRISTNGEFELDYTEKEKKQLLYHLYKLEL